MGVKRKVRNDLKLCFFLTLIILPFGAQKESLAKEPLEIFCRKTYQETSKCPQETCFLGCLGGVNYNECPFDCQPRPCAEIDAKNCPMESCDLLDGCDQKKVCYYKLHREEGTCGELAYAGQDIECCRGLVKRCGIEFFDGSCDMKGSYSLASVPICLPCGNGICNQFENKCNCPEDCR